MKPIALALLVAAASCTASGRRASPEPSHRSAPPLSARSVLHAYNVRLEAGGEGGFDRFAAVTDARGGLTVRLRGTDGSVRVCPTRDTSAKDPAPGDCTAPGNGVPVRIAAPGVLLVEPTGSADLQEVSISYDSADRRVRLRLATIAPKPGVSACKDNGCNPFFEMTPVRPGTLTATGTWDGIATGRLSVLTGGLASHDYARTGRPYRVADASEGSSDVGPPHLRVRTRVGAGTESGVVLEDIGARALLEPRLEIAWP